jgi:hypothetical protein
MRFLEVHDRYVGPDGAAADGNRGENRDPVQATPPHRAQLDEGGAIREQAFGSAKSGDASGTSGRARATRGLPLRPAG